LNNSF